MSAVSTILRMRQVLLVKTSSLGDVIHNFPVVTDILRHWPDAAVDWIVEEAFVDLPRLHPGVREVIPVAIRRWRRAWLKSAHRRELREFVARLRARRYDAVIDTQGLMKSALITRLARGVRVGFDRGSARERLASRFYQRRIDIQLGMHAVERNRQLAAAALGYELRGAAEYGIQVPLGAPPAHGERPYAVLLQATSRADKRWSEANWLALGRALHAQGLVSLIPGGSEIERNQAQALAEQVPGVRALPAMELRQVAALLAHAQAVIGVDTGLTHLACALGRPVVAIYAGSDPSLTGVYASERAVNLGDIGLPPTPEEVIAALRSLTEKHAPADPLLRVERGVG